MTILVLFWRKSIYFSRRYARKGIFYIFVLSHLDLWPLNLTFAPLCYSYSALCFHFSTAFTFGEIGGTERTDGRTGRVQLHLMQSRRDGRIRHKDLFILLSRNLTMLYECVAMSLIGQRYTVDVCHQRNVTLYCTAVVNVTDVFTTSSENVTITTERCPDSKTTSSRQS